MNGIEGNGDDMPKLTDAKGGGGLAGFRNRLMASKGEEFGSGGGSTESEASPDNKPDELDKRLSDEGRLTLIRDMTERKEKLRLDLKKLGVPLTTSEKWEKVSALQAQIINGALVYRDLIKHGKDIESVKQKVKGKLDKFHALEIAIEEQVVTAEHSGEEVDSLEPEQEGINHDSLEPVPAPEQEAVEPAAAPGDEERVATAESRNEEVDPLTEGRIEHQSLASQTAPEQEAVEPEVAPVGSLSKAGPEVESAEGVALDAKVKTCISRLEELSERVHGDGKMVQGLKNNVEIAESLLGKERSEEEEKKLNSLLVGFKGAVDSLEFGLKRVEGMSSFDFDSIQERAEAVLGQEFFKGRHNEEGQTAKSRMAKLSVIVKRGKVNLSKGEIEELPILVAELGKLEEEMEGSAAPSADRREEGGEKTVEPGEDHAEEQGMVRESNESATEAMERVAALRKAAQELFGDKRYITGFQDFKSDLQEIETLAKAESRDEGQEERFSSLLAKLTVSEKNVRIQTANKNKPEEEKDAQTEDSPDKAPSANSENGDSKEGVKNITKPSNKRRADLEAVPDTNNNADEGELYDRSMTRREAYRSPEELGELRIEEIDRFLEEKKEALMQVNRLIQNPKSVILSKIVKKGVLEEGNIEKGDQLEREIRKLSAEKYKLENGDTAAEEAKAKAEEEAKAKEEEEAKAEEEAKVKAEAKIKEEEALEKAEAEAKIKEEEALEKAEAEAKVKEEAEALAKAEEAEAKIKEEEALEKAEAEVKVKEEAEAKAKSEEAEAKVKAEAEAKAKAEAEAEATAEAEAKAKATVEALVKAEELVKAEKGLSQNRIAESIRDDVWGKILNGDPIPAEVSRGIERKIDSNVPLSVRENQILLRKQSTGGTTITPQEGAEDIESFTTGEKEVNKEVSDEEINEILENTPLPHGNPPNRAGLKKIQKEIYGNENKDVQRVVLKLVNERRYSNINNPPRGMKVPRDYYSKILQKFPTPKDLDEKFEKQQDDLRKELEAIESKDNEKVTNQDNLRRSAINFELGFFEEKKEDGSNGYKAAIEEFKRILYGERNEVWNKIKEDKIIEEADNRQKDGDAEEILEQPEEGIYETKVVKEVMGGESDTTKVEQEDQSAKESAPKPKKTTPPKPLMNDDIRSPEAKAAGDPMALVAKTERIRRGETVPGDIEGDFIQALTKGVKLGENIKSYEDFKSGLKTLIEGEGNDEIAFKKAEIRGREFIETVKNELLARFELIGKDSVQHLKELDEKIKKAKPGRLGRLIKSGKDHEMLTNERYIHELTLDGAGLQLGRENLLIERDLYEELLKKYIGLIPLDERKRMTGTVESLSREIELAEKTMREREKEIESVSPLLE